MLACSYASVDPCPSSFPFDSVSLPKVFTGLQIDRVHMLNTGNWMSLCGCNLRTHPRAESFNGFSFFLKVKPSIM